jgi:hypothetical protein
MVSVKPSLQSLPARLRLLALLAASRWDWVPVSRMWALKVTRSTMATRRGGGEDGSPFMNGRTVPMAMEARSSRLVMIWKSSSAPRERPDGAGHEIAGITREQMDAYSTRTVATRGTGWWWDWNGPAAGRHVVRIGHPSSLVMSAASAAPIRRKIS